MARRTKHKDWSAVFDRVRYIKAKPDTSESTKPDKVPRKDSLTAQKENSCLSMLLAGHYGTEKSENTATVVWGKDEFELIINLKKQ